MAVVAFVKEAVLFVSRLAGWPGVVAPPLRRSSCLAPFCRPVPLFLYWSWLLPVLFRFLIPASFIPGPGLHSGRETLREPDLAERWSTALEAAALRD